MELKDAIMKRYATKKFDGRRIDDQKLGELLEMIRYAPSAINLQPWKIKVISDQRLKDQLTPYTMGQQQVPTCSHLLVFCADTDFESRIKLLVEQMKADRLPEEMIGHMEEFLKGFSGRLTPEQKLAEAQKNVFLAAENALLGAKALGFDSCPMQGFDPAGYAKVLELPPTLVPTILVPVGYAADQPMPKRRLPKEDIFF